MPDYQTILDRRYKGEVIYVIRGDSTVYDNVEAVEGTTLPTKAELDAHWPAVETEDIAERNAEQLHRQKWINAVEAVGDQEKMIIGLAQDLATGTNVNARRITLAYNG